jgi:mRNA-degrading endonuclease RelE of RelBE toxin-antitoxin system
MKSRVTKEFRTRLECLPKEIREQAFHAYNIWRNNPYHNSLQFKRVSRRQPIYSVRIGIGYRAMGFRENDQIYWFWIGAHAEYDRLLKQFN